MPFALPPVRFPDPAFVHGTSAIWTKKKEKKEEEKERKFTICPAPMTPRRFTSAAGLAAVELKCLARLESRRACRADVIEAAIVCDEDCQLETKQLENLENLKVVERAGLSSGMKELKQRRSG